MILMENYHDMRKHFVLLTLRQMIHPPPPCCLRENLLTEHRAFASSIRWFIEELEKRTQFEIFFVFVLKERISIGCPIKRLINI